MGVGWRAEIRKSAPSTDFKEIKRLEGTEFSRVPIFSRYAMMRAWEKNSAGGLGAMLSSYRFHMGDRGYACLALALASSLEGAPPFVLSAHPEGVDEDDAKRL